MKPFLLLFISLTGFTGFTQSPTVTATKQGWAGGVCCVSGVNYTVTLLSFSPNEIKNLEITAVCIDGILFDAKKIQVVKAEKGNTQIVCISMGISHNEEIDRDPDSKVELYKPESCTAMEVTYSINGKKFSVAIKEITELDFLAYP